MAGMIPALPNEASLLRDEQPHTFARLLIAYLVNAGETRPIAYDESAFKLSVPGDDHSFWIGNLFLEYRRTPMDHWREFFETARDIWESVQGPDWPQRPQMLDTVRPLRDETHPLSYKVVPDSRGPYWQVRPPFVGFAGIEFWTLRQAYTVWLSEQYGRGFKPAYCRAYRWLSSGAISIDELRVWAEFKIVLDHHPIPASHQTGIVSELLWLLDQDMPPARIRQALQGFISMAGSANQAIDALRTADNIAELFESGAK
jgi:hypothetical protein